MGGDMTEFVDLFLIETERCCRARSRQSCRNKIYYPCLYFWFDFAADETSEQTVLHLHCEFVILFFYHTM